MTIKDAREDFITFSEYYRAEYGAEPACFAVAVEVMTKLLSGEEIDTGKDIDAVRISGEDKRKKKKARTSKSTDALDKYPGTNLSKLIEKIKDGTCGPTEVAKIVGPGGDSYKGNFCYMRVCNSRECSKCLADWLCESYEETGHDKF